MTVMSWDEWARHDATEAVGHVGITDVIILMGYYTSISMTLAFYDVPAGAPGMAR
jgi:4-carboxymuconolactone decarboxylase